MLSQIAKFERKFLEIAAHYASNGYTNSLTTNFDCYSNAIDSFEESCGKIPESLYGNLKYLYQICGR